MSFMAVPSGRLAAARQTRRALLSSTGGGWAGVLPFETINPIVSPVAVTKNAKTALKESALRDFIL